jgi:hypothetical protein
MTHSFLLCHISAGIGQTSYARHGGLFPTLVVAARIVPPPARDKTFCRNREPYECFVKVEVQEERGRVRIRRVIAK